MRRRSELVPLDLRDALAADPAAGLEPDVADRTPATDVRARPGLHARAQLGAARVIEVRATLEARDVDREAFDVARDRAGSLETVRLIRVVDRLRARGLGIGRELRDRLVELI